MAENTWSGFYSQAEQQKRNAYEAYLMLKGRSFVTKEQLLWYIDYLSKSSNNVTELVKRCRELDEAFDKALNIAKEEETRANKLSVEVSNLREQLAAKDTIIENLSKALTSN